MAAQMLSVRGSKGLSCVAQDPVAPAAGGGPASWSVVSKGEINAPYDESKNVKVCSSREVTVTDFF